MPPLLALIVAMRPSTSANQASKFGFTFSGGVPAGRWKFHFRHLPIESLIFGPYILGEALAGLGGPIRPLQRRHTESRSRCVLVLCTDQTSKVLQTQQVAAVTGEIACAGAVERTLPTVAEPTVFAGEIQASRSSFVLVFCIVIKPLLPASNKRVGIPRFSGCLEPEGCEQHERLVLAEEPDQIVQVAARQREQLQHDATGLLEGPWRRAHKTVRRPSKPKLLPRRST